MTDDGRTHDHRHRIDPATDRRALLIALLLILGFMVVEVVAGLAARSLALIGDAGHMLVDVGALG
ncbi:MAG TPA: cation transporter, partial [Actinomycetota bacterium]|nr:cation transporter [Actinomycetota bacterium]